ILVRLIPRHRARAFAEVALHHHGVEPAAELEADILAGADHLEAGRAVHADRGDVGGIADDGHHLAEAALFRLRNQLLHDQLAQPAALRLRIEIHRVLDAEAI